MTTPRKISSSTSIEDLKKENENGCCNGTAIFYSGRQTNGSVTLQLSKSHFSILLRFCGQFKKRSFMYFAFGIIICISSSNVFGNEDITVTNIAGVKYSIPSKYVGFPPKLNDNDLLINAVLPRMEALNRTSQILPESEKGNQVIILVHDLSSTTSLEYRFGVLQNIYGPLGPSGEKFGLNFYIASTEGIAPRSHDSSISKTQIYEEIYVAGLQTGSPSIFMNCDGDKAVISPGCELEFTSQNLLYEIHFPKTHIEHWRSIKRSAEQLIDSFRTTPSATLTP